MNQAPGSSQQPPSPTEDDDFAPPRRMFIFEPGWRIGVKTGSQREFCYTMAPGQDFYHRLLDGEIFLSHDDERLCLACAARRGLIVFEPRRLRDAMVPLRASTDAIPLDLDWQGVERSSKESFRDR